MNLNDDEYIINKIKAIRTFNFLVNKYKYTYPTDIFVLEKLLNVIPYIDNLLLKTDNNDCSFYYDFNLYIIIKYNVYKSNKKILKKIKIAAKSDKNKNLEIKQIENMIAKF